jgi:hypothetical protein
MALLLGRGDGRRERLRGGVQLGEHAAMERRQAAVLGGGEVGGQPEGAQRRERRPKRGELLLHLDGARRQARGRRRRPHGAERVREQVAPIARVGDAVGVHQRQGLARPQSVTQDGTEHRLLVRRGEGAQGVRHRRTDHADAELRDRRRREVRVEREPLLDPRGLVPEEARYAGDREAVVVHERAHHARLVGGRDGARRRVGREQPALVLGRAARRLEHDRHLGAAGLPPAREAFEAVEHLVVPVVRRHDPQRQLDEVVGSRR